MKKNVIICKLVFEKCTEDPFNSVVTSVVPVSSPLSIDEKVLDELLSGTEYVCFEVPQQDLN